MVLEFKLYKLRETSKTFDRLNKLSQKAGTSFRNELIVVGEEVIQGKEYFKANGLNERGLCLIADLKLDEFCYSVPKEDLELKKDECSWEGVDLDIPNKNLTMDLISNIQRLNS